MTDNAVDETHMPAILDHIDATGFPLDPRYPHGVSRLFTAVKLNHLVLVMFEGMDRQIPPALDLPLLRNALMAVFLRWIRLSGITTQLGLTRLICRTRPPQEPSTTH